MESKPSVVSPNQDKNGSNWMASSVVPNAAEMSHKRRPGKCPLDLATRLNVTVLVTFMGTVSMEYGGRSQIGDG